jgi:hypothetical protein
VRLSPPLTVIALVLVALGALGYSRENTDSLSDAGCDVATAYLSYLFRDSYLASYGEPIVLSSEPEGVSDYIERYINRRGDHVDLNSLTETEPLIDLYLELQALNGLSVVKTCPSVPKLLQSSDISKKIISDDVAALMSKNSSKFKYTTVRISMPAVDIKRGEAILVQSQVSGPLAAGGGEVYLRRSKNGIWRVVYEKGLWVS